MKRRRPSAVGCRLATIGRRRSAVGYRLALLLGLVGAPTTLAGQQFADRRPPTADSASGLRPGAAFWRSLLIPGWGQAATKRWVTGATFTAWEGVCVMMFFKAKGEVKHIEAVGALHVSTKKQEVQDWAVLLIFNHLFAGAEAFVSSHLQDFPADLHIRAAPRGLMVSMPLPRP